MLSRITITCFAASYGVTLGLEVSRLFFRLPVRWIVMIAFAAAGLFAHTAYLWEQARNEVQRSGLSPLSSWYDWCLLGAWVLAATYLGLAIRRPRNTVGLFLIPMILLLIATAYAVRGMPHFVREEALSYWGIIHGVLLLLGTVVAALGFVAGIMYLLQSYRLKQNRLPRPGFRLPSLEWLQRFNRHSLSFSTVLLALGLLAGLVLNVIRHSNQVGMVSWTDPVVLSSSVLFLWLAIATLFESLYKPARQGRKVAYITLFSFVFLGLVLALVLLGRHGITQSRATAPLREHQQDHASHIELPPPGSGGAG